MPGRINVVTLAMNLMSHGVDPGLDLSDIDGLRTTAEWCNRLPVHPRHPYAGDLVYTAFSGSHQDAIKKGFDARFAHGSDYDVWDVPYLPIDPAHVGRTYEAVIRVNSQSGKGGVAYVMEAEHGFVLPRGVQLEFSKIIQAVTADTGTEIEPDQMWHTFSDHYLPLESRVMVRHHDTAVDDHGRARLRAGVVIDGVAHEVVGDGAGPIDCFVHAIGDVAGIGFDVVDYVKHARGEGSEADAAAYVACRQTNGIVVWGVGVDNNVVTAGLQAVCRAISRPHPA